MSPEFELTVAGACVDRGHAFLISPLPEFSRLGASEPSPRLGFPVRISLRLRAGETKEIRWRIVSEGPRFEVDGDPSATDGVMSRNGATFSIVVEALDASSRPRDATLHFEAQRGEEIAPLSLSVCSDIEVWFGGVFEARFSTDGSIYNSPEGNPQGIANGGRSFRLLGEPPFCPDDPRESVPRRNKESPEGRVIHFQNCVGVVDRSHARPVGVSVTAVHGRIGRQVVRFTEGDHVIGSSAHLGEGTYFAANFREDERERPPYEQYKPGREPLDRFEFELRKLDPTTGRIETLLKGGSFTNGTADVEFGARRPFTGEDHRPRPDGRKPAGYELDMRLRARFGIRCLEDFSLRRAESLLADRRTTRR